MVGADCLGKMSWYLDGRVVSDLMDVNYLNLILSILFRLLIGQMSEIGLTEQFLASWSHCVNQGEITYPEFEDYYEGKTTKTI